MLEPLLRVINCSLPVLRPVGQKLFACFGKTYVLLSNNPHRTSANPVLSIGTRRQAPKVQDPYPLDLATVPTLDDGSQIELWILSEHNIATTACLRDPVGHHVSHETFHGLCRSLSQVSLPLQA
jgi:hypothetical protein